MFYFVKRHSVLLRWHIFLEVITKYLPRSNLDYKSRIRVGAEERSGGRNFGEKDLREPFTRQNPKIYTNQLGFM